MRTLSAKNDYAFKRIFGREQNKDITIAFLNTILKDQLHKPVVSLKFLNPVQDPAIRAKKQSIVDVLCKDQDGCRYIVEMQVAKQETFIKRAQYYATKAYASQIDKGGIYEDLKKIIFLAFTNYTLFPEKKHYKSNHEIRDKKTHENDLKDLRFTFVDLHKFEIERTKPVKDLSLEEKFYYFLANAESVTPTEKEALVQEPIIKKALYQLSRFNWTEEELLQYDEADKIERDNRAAMVTKFREGIKKGKELAKRDLITKLEALGANKSVAEAIKQLKNETKTI